MTIRELMNQLEQIAESCDGWSMDTEVTAYDDRLLWDQGITRVTKNLNVSKAESGIARSSRYSSDLWGRRDDSDR